MVTTYKKLRAQEWTWSGSGFTRQTPSEKQTTAPKPSLVYKRARYYHPQLGQFVSRDPWGYVDGMSQYRGYFVPGSMDPTGLECDYHCCTFEGAVNSGTWLAPVWFLEQFSKDVKSDGKGAASTCQAEATANGWTLLGAESNPCEKGGRCNIGQQKGDAKAVGIAYLRAGMRGHPNDGDLIGDLGVWMAALTAVGSAGGPISTVTNIAGSEGPGASDAQATLDFFNNQRNKPAVMMDVWIKVEGTCCEDAMWGNSFETHEYWFNATAGNSIENKKLASVVNKNLLGYQKKAEAAFDCGKEMNSEKWGADVQDFLHPGLKK